MASAPAVPLPGGPGGTASGPKRWHRLHYTPCSNAAVSQRRHGCKRLGGAGTWRQAPCRWWWQGLESAVQGEGAQGRCRLCQSASAHASLRFCLTQCRPSSQPCLLTGSLVACPRVFHKRRLRAAQPLCSRPSASTSGSTFVVRESPEERTAAYGSPMSQETQQLADRKIQGAGSWRQAGQGYLPHPCAQRGTSKRSASPTQTAGGTASASRRAACLLVWA